MQSAMPLLEIKKAQKSFAGVKVLTNISFTIYEGEIIGFLGRNGSGKTTTIRLMLNLLQKDEGAVYFQGRNTAEDTSYLKKIGYVQQSGGVIDDLTLQENLRFFAQLCGVSQHNTKERLTYYTNQFKMSQLLHKKVKTFSQGMKQKVKIMRALLHHPALLILDEPLTSLDPWEQENAIAVLKSFAADKNKAIFLSSHIIPDIQRLATRVLFLNNGTMEKELKTNDISDNIKSLFHGEK